MVWSLLLARFKPADIVGPDAGDGLIQQRLVRGERQHPLRRKILPMEFINTNLRGGGLFIHERLGAADHLFDRVRDAVVVGIAVAQGGHALRKIQHQVGFELLRGAAREKDAGFARADGLAGFQGLHGYQFGRRHDRMAQGGIVVVAQRELDVQQVRGGVHKGHVGDGQAVDGLVGDGEVQRGRADPPDVRG